ncbi:MAG: GNAT family N-acetyltransferase [Planctomycetota bacterium]
MIIRLQNATLRPLATEDAESLAGLANNRRVADNLRDRFPHPYTVADAEEFIALVGENEPQTVYGIEVDGRAVGTIGLELGQDVERLSAELGYWIGEPYWGRGIISDAIPAVVDDAFERLGLSRLIAVVFDCNPASARVLEKSGFYHEATLQRSAVKNGKVIDRWLYARLKDVP